MKLDAAVLRAVSLPSTTQATISSYDRSWFASTSRVTLSLPSGATQSLFLKTSSAQDAATMFEGEHASLNAINDAMPSLCPRSLGWGPLDKEAGYFLVTEFLELSARMRPGERKGSGVSLARKLATLHSTPAPIPEGFTEPMFGFPVPTCCGNTVQRNRWKRTWAEFYTEERLGMIVQKVEESNYKDPALRDMVENVMRTVVPRLLGEGHLGGEAGIRPVLVHGDLWSGNKGTGVIQRAGVESRELNDVVFDPSACYAHNEFELGIMKMFGGFGSAFLAEYHEYYPMTEPVEEYEDRVLLYELYHHLNHYAIFGGGYRGSSVNIMKGLLKKYG